MAEWGISPTYTEAYITGIRQRAHPKEKVLVEPVGENGPYICRTGRDNVHPLQRVIHQTRANRLRQPLSPEDPLPPSAA